MFVLLGIKNTNVDFQKQEYWSWHFDSSEICNFLTVNSQFHMRATNTDSSLSQTHLNQRNYLEISGAVPVRIEFPISKNALKEYYDSS